MTIFDGARLNNYMTRGSDDKRILRYLRKTISNSLLGYQVNGNPEKRKFVLMDIATSMLNKLSPTRKSDILHDLDQDQ